mmetsp:Transcript_12722/g.57402  ORF Transcript_12722/g.57402 Transcript_12722/m.57402 type:complete len:262 (+) Transcript_12722:467-1252(+)
MGAPAGVRQPQRAQRVLRRPPLQGGHRRMAPSGEDAVPTQRRRHLVQRRRASDAQPQRRRQRRRRRDHQRAGLRGRRHRLAQVRRGGLLAQGAPPAAVEGSAVENPRRVGALLELQHGMQLLSHPRGLARVLPALRRHRRVHPSARGQEDVAGVSAEVGGGDAAAVLEPKLWSGRNRRARAGGDPGARGPALHAPRDRAPGALRPGRPLAARDAEHEPVQHVGGPVGGCVSRGAARGGGGGARAAQVPAPGLPDAPRREGG